MLVVLDFFLHYLHCVIQKRICEYYFSTFHVVFSVQDHFINTN